MKTDLVSGAITYRDNKREEADFLSRIICGWHILDFITGKPYRMRYKDGSIEFTIEFTQVPRAELTNIMEYLKLEYPNNRNLIAQKVIRDFQALLDKQ